MADSSKFGRDMQLKMMSATMSQLDELQTQVQGESKNQRISQVATTSVDLSKIERVITNQVADMKATLPEAIAEQTKDELLSINYHIQSCIAEESKKQGELTRNDVSRYIGELEESLERAGLHAESNSSSIDKKLLYLAVGCSAFAAITSLISLIMTFV